MKRIAEEVKNKVIYDGSKVFQEKAEGMKYLQVGVCFKITRTLFCMVCKL